MKPRDVAKAGKIHAKNAKKLAERGHDHVAAQEAADAKKIEKMLESGGYNKHGRSKL